MAASTTSVALASSAFVLVGVAPLILQAVPGSTIVVAVAPSLPAANAAGLRLEPGDPPLPITGAANVYARSVSATGKVISAVLA